MPTASYSLGLDFGTSSVRALLVDTRDGSEVGTGVSHYRHGEAGVISDPGDPHLARQHPADYEVAMLEAVQAALADAAAKDRFDPEQVIGIGIDATASTPLPVDEHLRPIALRPQFDGNLHAMAWLWKDHTSHQEAQAIADLARERLPDYLERSGHTYSSEWYFAKLWHCLRVAPEVLEVAAGWVELGDYISGLLVGCDSPAALGRNVCAAGHKAFYHETCGLPPLAFFAALDPALGQWCRGKLYEKALPSGTRAGGLAPAAAAKLSLPAGIPVALASIDAHSGAVGAGIRPGVMVKILGTSSCDMLVHPAGGEFPVIPGVAGVVRDSIIPRSWGIEAGQAAVGDIFGWFVRGLLAESGVSFEDLEREASQLHPGESGLLALDWNNGNRSILADPLLTGCLVGQTLNTRAPEVYRALIEATAFGARVIVERLAAHGVAVEQIIACGGIAEKSPLLLEIYAGVVGRPLELSRSEQTCALGAAIFGAVAAGACGGGHDSVDAAERCMTGLKPHVHRPEPEAVAVYNELFALYMDLHDAFGRQGEPRSLHHVMKKLLEIQSRERRR